MAASGPQHRHATDFSYREFKVVIGIDKSGGYRALARDAAGTEVASVDGGSQDDVATAIKLELNGLSQDFWGIEGAINLFLKAFPGGFGDPFCVYSERTYKDDAAAFVGQQLSAKRTTGLISDGDYRAIADAAQRAIQRTNIAFRFEAMALGAALKHDATMKAFVLALADMLYGDDFGAGLDAMVKALEPSGAARWPLVTYFPFLGHPDKHMFVKPEIVKTCAHRLGFELDYDSRPNMSTYTDVLRLTEHIRESVSVLDPRDNIDIQTFMYVVAKDGYLTDSKAARERWESA